MSKNTKIIKGLHLVNAFLGITFGLAAVVCTEKMASSLGIAFPQPSGLTEFRAMYGGVVLACGIFFALAFKGFIDDKSGLWMSLLFYAVVAPSRLAGILMDGPQELHQYDFLIFESVLLVWSVVALKRLRAVQHLALQGDPKQTGTVRPR
ncbi:DUF4345 domain-containing protein [bacterium]|nr:DUF4345 domain-containing protein [bacterium]